MQITCNKKLHPYIKPSTVLDHYNMYFASNIETVERVDIKVLIVGAGPAGIGTASALKQAGVEEMLVVDLREIGSSFLNWPKQMSFLTPSFHSKSFGLTDMITLCEETTWPLRFNYMFPEWDRGVEVAK